MTELRGPATSAEEQHPEGGDADVKAAFFPDVAILQSALEAATIGVWSLDVASERMTWSSNLEAIHRLPIGSFDGTLAFVHNDMHPDDRSVFDTFLQDAKRSNKPCRMLYRLPAKPEHEERWVEALALAQLKDGKVAGMVGTCRDVTDRVRLHRELQIRASQQEAVARLSERALTEVDVDKFFDDTVAAVAQILDVGLVKILELLPGETELLLRAGFGWKPGLVGRAHISTGQGSMAGFTLATGVPVVVENLADEKRFTGQWLLHDHAAVSGIACPIAGHDGRAYGVITAHTITARRFTDYDVSFVAAVANVIAGAIQRRHLDQRQELMIRELRHRSGNLFSQLLALFSQTAKNSKNIADLVPKYEARVLALANAHRLVTEGGWKSASLTELLNTLLAPYLDRITFAGPSVFIEADPTFALSMAIHELATNASKHGSLASRQGRVEVTWQVQRADLGLTLLLNWREREGSAPKRQRRTGFGSRLITMVVERQLNGKVQMTFKPEGLDVQMVVPLTHERWLAGAERPGETIEPAPPV